MSLTEIKLRRSLFLSRLFSWAWDRHLQTHEGDYEVCRDTICNLIFGLECMLWYKFPRRKMTDIEDTVTGG